MTVNVIIPHVLGREKFLITNGNRKGAKRKSLRGEVFRGKKKKTSEVGGCLFPTLCSVLYAARLPAADVVASSVFKRETKKKCVCGRARDYSCGTLFSLSLSYWSQIEIS